jgi:hypothetical protein
MNRTLRNWTRAGFVASALVVGLRIQPAAADVRIRARVVTPNVQVELSNRPSRHFEPGIVRVVDRSLNCSEPARQARFRGLSAYDRRVASELAYLSGVPRRVLLNERAYGMSWEEIARRHHLQKRWLRASFELAERGDSGRGHGRDHRHRGYGR